MKQKNHHHHLETGFIMGAPLFFGLLGLAIGKDASWDFLNYHWYNPYALLTGRLGFDMAVAHHATFYNPLVDTPFFLLARHFPAWIAGFFLTTMQGINCSLLFCIASTVLAGMENRTERFLLAAAIATAGMMGGGALGQLGVTSNDTLVSIGILAMILVIVAKHDILTAAPAGKTFAWAALAGVAGGAAVGLKLTAAMYAVGFGLAMAVLSAPLGRRLGLLLALGIGGGAGFLLFAGPWMMKLHNYTGNPLFPYFNNFFRSPLLISASYRDTNFIPTETLKILFFPFFFTMDSHHVAEFFFRDVRILLGYVLVPTCFLISWFGGSPKKIANSIVTSPVRRYLMTGAIISYVLWLLLFGIYRYLIVLEMLAPLLITMAIALLPLATRRVMMVSLLLLFMSQALVSVGFDGRLPWTGKYVDVRVPPIARPESSMVLMTGYAPMAYVIPSFPPEIPFLRIHSYLAGPGGEETGFGAEMRRRVAAHQGDFYALFSFAEKQGSMETLAAYGFTLANEDCASVTANIGEPLSFCKLARSR